MTNPRPRNLLLKRLILTALLPALAAVGCDRSQSKTENKLVVTGSSTIAPLMSEIARRFEQRNPGLRVDVQTGGSSRGIADATRGLADVGMVSRSPRADEQDKLVWHRLAGDGICMIVHRSNPVPGLTDAQIIDIYTGKITNWKEVGGADAPISVVNKAEGRSTLEVFLKYFKLKNPAIKADVIIGDNQQGVKTVAGNPNAIAYVSVGTAEFEADRGTAIKLLPAAGVAATVANVRRGSYPVARVLHLVTKGTPQGAAKALVDFAKSKEVHDLVEGQFFVPLEN